MAVATEPKKGNAGTAHVFGALQWIVFATSLLLFLCSLLVVFSAPTTALWIVAIVIAEWGHFVAFAALFLAAISWRRGRLGAITAMIALATALLCLLPSLRAAAIARTLPARCVSAFGEATNPKGRTVPFNLIDLFRGVPTDGVEVTEHVFATDGTKQLKLSLYQAKESAGPQPIVIIVHGGGWYRGNKEQLPAIDRHLAREHYAVASINYRHAPKFTSPAAVEDVFRSIAFLKTNAARWQLDPTRIVLIGRSAGRADRALRRVRGEGAGDLRSRRLLSALGSCARLRSAQPALGARFQESAGGLPRRPA